MADRKRRIMIVDDDREIHLATKFALRDKYDCVSAFNGDEAKIILKSQTVDVILLDLNIRTAQEGLEYLPAFREIDTDVDVIIVSGNTEVDLASRAIRAGASSYLVKDHSQDQLIITIESVLSRRELMRENSHYIRDRKRLLEKNRIIGDSPAMKALAKDIDKVRRSRANVIITAETGCGKELVARHIGAADGRPFVAVDSATITSTMAESILFGHEKGAFTGALAATKGLFEEANGGTIYFDEIGNMPLEIQTKLLRVLQEKEITRVGSTKIIPLDFRVICATNKDLEKLVAEGKFLEDFYQRLNVISLRIPPLRERGDDIRHLVPHFFSLHHMDGSAKGLSEDALVALMKYRWPGNVRELSNVVANLCAMITDQDVVEVEDLPPKIRQATLAGSAAISAPSIMASAPRSDAPANFAPTASGNSRFGNLREVFANPEMDYYKYVYQFEGELLAELYRAFEGNISNMSKTLRISRSHLYAKLNNYRIHG